MYVCVVLTFSDDPNAVQRGEIAMSTPDFKTASRWQRYKATRVSTPHAAFILFAGETKPWDVKGRTADHAERLSEHDFDQSGED